MIYIPINKEAIPCRFDIDIGGELFEFEVHYNQRYDYFTINLSKDGEVLVIGEKIVYGRALFTTNDDPRLPTLPITPFDEAGDEVEVNYKNFGENVFLFVGDPDE